MIVGYLIRMSFTWAKSLTCPKTKLLEPVRLPMRVWLNDIDIYGHLNNGRFLTLMDQGRLFHAFVCGWLPLAFKKRWKPIAAAASIVFRRELKPFDPFVLFTRVAYWDARAFYMEHRMEKDGRLYSKAFVQIVFKNGRQTISPQTVAEAMGHQGPAPECPEALIAWISSLTPQRE